MSRHTKKIWILVALVIVYIGLGIGFRYGVMKGYIAPEPKEIVEQATTDVPVKRVIGDISPYLANAQYFFNNNFVTNSSHINLGIALGVDANLSDNRTNSEAMSYYLLWTAQQGDRSSFDKALAFMRSKMMHPRYKYLMWRLDSNDSVVGDGGNIATDADLRAIKALLIAESNWKDKTYTQTIDDLASGLEQLAITDDNMLAPYAGVSGESSIWKASEVWLSYSDFTVFKELAKRRGEPWKSVYNNMKQATINAQIYNGLYNTQLTDRREYGSSPDNGGYSINSMWMMVRAAESGDQELMYSANKSLSFYKTKMKQDGAIYASYGSNSAATSPSDTPWAYALVGRAAIALGDTEFAQEMMTKLAEKQITNKTSIYNGALPEGFGATKHISQFTMQESIITMQDYIKSTARFSNK